MNIKPESATEKQLNITTDLLLIALLSGWAFFVNRGIRISGLYMDDLYMWSCYGEQSFREYVFPVGSTRFRFVYWFFAWIELGIVRNHMNWIVPINILLNAGLAAGLYMAVKKLSASRTAGFLAGILFLSSRFAYYQIGQLLGLMETLGIFFAVGMCLCLFRYLRDGKRERFFFLGLLFWFLNCFTHERYMVLFPMLLYVLVIRKNRGLREWGSAFLSLGAVLGIRRIFIGTLSPAGTGGTNVADTITKAGVVRNFLSELAYAFGINDGPEHLNGLPWHQLPIGCKALVLGADFLLLVFLIFFLMHIAERNRYGLPIGSMLADIVLFLGFMIGCTTASAVTIRVEMRWVYVIYTFGLLLFGYLLGALTQCRIRRDKDEEAESRYRISDLFPLGLLILFTLIMVPLELFMRSGYPKIYLFLNQKRYNSLADETYGKYGKDIFAKEIIIIGNSYKMSDFTAGTFFKTFDPQRTAEGTTVKHVDTIRDIGQVTDRMLVLKEDASQNLFSDVTDMMRAAKCGIYYGYYRDGWMDQNAEIDVMTGADGKVELKMMYPGNLTGSEQVKIWENDSDPITIDVKTNVFYQTMYGVPYQIVHLKFSTNFKVEDATEMRGTDPLSMIVTITTQ